MTESQIASIVEDLTNENEQKRAVTIQRLEKVQEQLELSRKQRLEKRQEKEKKEKKEKVLKFGTLRKDSEGEWKQEVTDTGKTYYYHTVTRQTSWEKPEQIASSDETLTSSTKDLQIEEKMSNSPIINSRASTQQEAKIKQGNINFIASVKLSSSVKGLQLNSLIQAVIFKIAVAQRLEISCVKGGLQENKRKVNQMGTLQKDLSDILSLLKEIPDSCYLEDMQEDINKAYAKLGQAVENVKAVITTASQETDNTRMPTHFRNLSESALQVLHSILALLKLNDEIFQNDIIDMCRNILLLLKTSRDANSMQQLTSLNSESSNHVRLLTEMVKERAEMLDDVAAHDKLLTSSSLISEAIPQLMTQIKLVIQNPSKENIDQRNIMIRNVSAAISEIIKLVKVFPKFVIETSS